jgi:hypothetical protein
LNEPGPQRDEVTGEAVSTMSCFHRGTQAFPSARARWFGEMGNACSRIGLRIVCPNQARELVALRADRRRHAGAAKCEAFRDLDPYATALQQRSDRHPAAREQRTRVRPFVKNTHVRVCSEPRAIPGAAGKDRETRLRNRSANARKNFIDEPFESGLIRNPVEAPGESDLRLVATRFRGENIVPIKQ